MNPEDPNVQILQAVAVALGSLREAVVFVGGCAAGLLITDTARPVVRATQDVDVVAEVHSKIAYYQLCDQLRALGFKEDDNGSVICRWRFQGLMVDVMPPIEGILGFSNRWYPSTLQSAESVVLPNGLSIRLINAPHFIATKIEAFYGRGAGDFSHHDIEDIVNVFDGRPELAVEIQRQSLELQDYLREEIEDFLFDAEFQECLPQHFRPYDQGRIAVVIERMRKVAGL
jgi:predicted nucleotidyltransferase